MDSDHTNGQTRSGNISRAPQRYDVPATSLDLRQSPLDRWLIGESAPMRKVKRLVIEAAAVNSTVLIVGETGTGKEPVANAIHHCSDRCKQPLIKMNCACGPEHLLEDELFGHVKGAFTGAHSARKGRFELARGGALMLDEIGEMRPELQAKLLRVLQEREFERVGSSETIKVNTRIFAATNRDLKRAIKDGSFRLDLYYRLAVIEIYLPPLRDRRSDIPLLALHLLANKQESAEWKRPVSFTPRGLKVLCECDYDWPGNVRELENTVERLGARAATGSGAITEDDVFELFVGHTPGSPGDESATSWLAGGSADQILLEQERAMFREALAMAKGNKTKAACILGLRRGTFRSRLKKLEEHNHRRLR